MHTTNQRASGSAVSSDSRGYGRLPPLTTWTSSSPTHTSTMHSGSSASMPTGPLHNHEAITHHSHYPPTHHSPSHRSAGVPSDFPSDTRRHHPAYGHTVTAGYPTNEVVTNPEAGTHSHGHRHSHHHSPYSVAPPPTHHQPHLSHHAYGTSPVSAPRVLAGHHPHHTTSYRPHGSVPTHASSHELPSIYTSVTANESSQTGGFAHSHGPHGMPSVHPSSANYGHQHHLQHTAHTSQSSQVGSADRKYTSPHMPIGESGDRMTHHIAGPVDHAMVPPHPSSTPVARRKSIVSSAAYPYDVHSHTTYGGVHAQEGTHTGWGHSERVPHVDTYAGHHPYSGEHSTSMHHKQLPLSHHHHHHHPVPPHHHHHSSQPHPGHVGSTPYSRTQYADGPAASSMRYASSPMPVQPPTPHAHPTGQVSHSHHTRDSAVYGSDLPASGHSIRNGIDAGYGHTSSCDGTNYDGAGYYPANEPNAAPHTNGISADAGYANLPSTTGGSHHTRPNESAGYRYGQGENTSTTEAGAARPHMPSANGEQRVDHRDWQANGWSERAPSQTHPPPSHHISTVDSADQSRDYAAHKTYAPQRETSQSQSLPSSRPSSHPSTSVGKPPQRSYYSHQLLQPQPPLASPQTTRGSYRPSTDHRVRHVVDLTGEDVEMRLSSMHRYMPSGYGHQGGSAGHLHHGHLNGIMDHPESHRSAYGYKVPSETKMLTDDDAANILSSLKTAPASQLVDLPPDSPSGLLELAQQKVAEMMGPEPEVQLDPVITAWMSGQKATILAQFGPVVSPFNPQAVIANIEDEEEEEEEEAKEGEEEKKEGQEKKDDPDDKEDTEDKDQDKSETGHQNEPGNQGGDGSPPPSTKSESPDPKTEPKDQDPVKDEAIEDTVPVLATNDEPAPNAAVSMTSILSEPLRSSQKRSSVEPPSEEKPSKRLANDHDVMDTDPGTDTVKPSTDSPVSTRQSENEATTFDKAPASIEEEAVEDADSGHDTDETIVDASISAMIRSNTAATPSSLDMVIDTAPASHCGSSASSPLSLSSQSAPDFDKQDQKTTSETRSGAASPAPPTTPHRRHATRIHSGRVSASGTSSPGTRTPVSKRPATPAADESCPVQDTVNWEILDLPKGVKERAYEIFKDVLVSKDFQRIRPTSKRREALLMAITLILCRQSNIPRTFAELSKAAQVAKRDIGACYKWLCNTLNPDLAVVRHIEPDEFMKRWCNALELHDYVLPAAIYCYRQTDRLGVFSGKCPTSVAAASIWFVIWTVNNAATILQETRKGRDFSTLRCSSSYAIFSESHILDRTPRITCDQKTVASVAGVVIATLMSTYKGMVPHVNKLTPPGFLEALLDDGLRVVPDSVSGIGKLYARGKLVEMPSISSDYRSSDTQHTTPADNHTDTKTEETTDTTGTPN